MSADDVADGLLRRLAADGRVPAVSRMFAAAGSNADRVAMAAELLEEFEAFPETCEDTKSDKFSEEARRQGNDMFKIKKRKEAIELYTRSLCMAETKPVLALAYANRSAVLLEIGLIGECLRDIERALANNYPENLKEKLIARKNKATNEMKNYTPIQYHCQIPHIPREHRNKLIECASNAVELKTNPEQGRHVVATRKIEIGEIIAVEKPFSHILIEDFLTHCHCCLKLCYDLVPCENCTQTLYCSDACKKEAYKHHQYECNILLTTKLLEMDKLKLLPLRIALSVKELYESIENDSLDKDDDIYKSNRYYEIHKLVANTEKRSVADLFTRAVKSAIISRLVETATNFFNDGSSKRVFNEIVMLHMQTGACNFHQITEITPNEQNMYLDSEIGAGAYPFLSMFNHACNPNVSRTCYGPILVIRAIETIEKGEQCYENYGYLYPMMIRDERRTKLKNQYFFDCSCEACEKDFPLYQHMPKVSSRTVPEEYISRLTGGDTELAVRISDELADEMREIERFKPEVSFCDYQEALKQCFQLCGNIRRTVSDK